MPKQRRFTKPRRATFSYDSDEAAAGIAGPVAGADTEVAGKHYVTVNWLMSDVLDSELTMALEVLGRCCWAARPRRCAKP